MINKYLLIDRDGTLIVEKNYLCDPDGVEIFEGVATTLNALREEGWGVIVVTNQSGVGRGLYGPDDVHAVHARIRDDLAVDGAIVDGFYFCPHLPNADCLCRKPNRGMVDSAAKDFNFDPTDSIVIGDKICDIDLGINIGAKSVLVRTGYGAGEEHKPEMHADFIIDSLADLQLAIGALVNQ